MRCRLLLPMCTVSVSQSVCHVAQLGFIVRDHSVQPLPNHFGLLFPHMMHCTTGLLAVSQCSARKNTEGFRKKCKTENGCWWRAAAVNTVGLINEVNQRRARLVIGWVAVFGRVNHYVCDQPTRSAQPSIPPGSVNEDQIRLGRQRQVWFFPSTGG